MKNVKVTRSQYKVLQILSRRDISAIRKSPSIVSAAKDLLWTCRKILKRVETTPEHASRRKRRTAYRKIAALCEKAIAKSQQKSL